MSLASRLKQRREELGLTQVELAKLIGVTKGAVGNYETGVSSMKAEVLYRICDVLQCDPNFLFQDEMKILQARPKEEISKQELDMLKKYRALDDYGRETVELVLNREYNRVNADGQKMITGELAAMGGQHGTVQVSEEDALKARQLLLSRDKKK